MSKLAEFKRIEQELADQLAALDKLKSNAELKKEMEFEERLRDLLAEYGFSLREVISIFEPVTYEAVSPNKGRQRKTKVYVNPNTNERVETKGGNHKVLKAWREEYGSEAVDSWLQ